MSRVLPILFNTEMVRAILDGLKGATRRIVKGFIPDDAIWGYTAFTPKGYISCRGTFADGYGEKFFKLPCEPGDILYVRECGIIQSMKNFDKTVKMYFPADDTLIEFKVTPDEYERLSRFPEDKKLSPYWLTKQESRIWLKVKDVRVERLQDITDEDCEKEGLENYCKKCQALFSDCDTCLNDEGVKEDFKELWNSTIKKSDLDRYGWDASPWVWVIEFERCEKPAD